MSNVLIVYKSNESGDVAQIMSKSIQWNSVNKSSRLLHPICLERNRLVHFRKRRLLKPPRIKSKIGCPEVDLLTEFHCIEHADWLRAKNSADAVRLMSIYAVRKILSSKARL